MATGKPADDGPATLALGALERYEMEIDLTDLHDARSLTVRVEQHPIADLDRLRSRGHELIHVARDGATLTLFRIFRNR